MVFHFEKNADSCAFTSIVNYLLIHQHEAKSIAGFCFFPQGFNMAAIVPSCLKHINAA
jgi:hypothetical protein